MAHVPPFPPPPPLVAGRTSGHPPSLPPPRAARKASSSHTALWVVLGGSAALVCGLLVLLGIVVTVRGEHGPSSASTDVAPPADSGWPMDISVSGTPGRTFPLRAADGSPTVVSLSVHAPRPFLELGASTFSFEVCRLENGARSRFHCDLQRLFVDPAKKSQKDGARSYTVREGPGVYLVRVVEFGTFGAEDKVYSTASFVITAP